MSNDKERPNNEIRWLAWKDSGEWTIGQWEASWGSSGSWFVIGSDEPYDDGDFNLIGPIITLPSEL